ncbi:hypothetical protein IEN91_20620 (plasmid) [Bacillus velezensis]|nr:hypothetical protein [Bacillus velezensis]QPK90950.1 hypothetical protein IEN91_20620 [Bacillus velezensis]
MPWITSSQYQADTHQIGPGAGPFNQGDTTMKVISAIIAAALTLWAQTAVRTKQLPDPQW